MEVIFKLEKYQGGTKSFAKSRVSIRSLLFMEKWVQAKLLLFMLYVKPLG